VDRRVHAGGRSAASPLEAISIANRSSLSSYMRLIILVSVSGKIGLKRNPGWDALVCEEHLGVVGVGDG